jgi:hypothetical protein
LSEGGGEARGRLPMRVKFECCKCGRIAVVRVVDAKEDQ